MDGHLTEQVRLGRTGSSFSIGSRKANADVFDALNSTPLSGQDSSRYAGRMKLVKVDVDQNPGLANRFQAMSIPLLVLFEQGHEVDRQVGAVPESRLATWIGQHVPETARSSPSESPSP